MRLLTANHHLSNKTLFNPFTPPSISSPNNSKFPSSFNPQPRKFSPISASLSSPETITIPVSTEPIVSDWPRYAQRVSGEWDGFGADFTSAGAPIELPENVVPEAYREWEVKVFDWQTQCPTLASEAGDPILSYKLIKLLPTVGCEADAATRHSVDERVAGGTENTALGLGYDVNGSYVGVWGVKGGFELEHCLVHPSNGEVRVRVVMVVKVEGGEGLKIAGVRVFSEQWYGPWRNGEQLGGCAIRESGFAQGERVEVEDVVGVWEGKSLKVARFGSETKDVVRGLVEERPRKSIRDQEGVVALPKKLWCSMKDEEGETTGEVGWLIEPGVMMISRCVFVKDGTLKEMAIGQETAAAEGV